MNVAFCRLKVAATLPAAVSTTAVVEEEQRGTCEKKPVFKDKGAKFEQFLSVQLKKEYACISKTRQDAEEAQVERLLWHWTHLWRDNGELSKPAVLSNSVRCANVLRNRNHFQVCGRTHGLRNGCKSDAAALGVRVNVARRKDDEVGDDMGGTARKVSRTCLVGSSAD
ncbi:hypothetical protein HPB50_009503 [Hyalomma asiaticum]|uniref:Uncharacterized protein n=1 Tax=Hyalomma asiaticum TaxID=266040 RepID=A0ACB7RK05_HYAAI|nr:hypothetical protein HPB50_009503 [Hyalomma asiaticum]